MQGTLKCSLSLIAFCAVVLSSCNATPKPIAKAEPEKPRAAPVQEAPVDPEEPVVAPEIVRLQDLEIMGDTKALTMKNAAGEYHLACNREARGCESPTPGKNYLLFNDRTHWRLPGAKSYIDLALIQNWTVTYNKGENVGLVPEDNSSGFRLGLYMLESWKPSYQ